MILTLQQQLDALKHKFNKSTTINKQQKLIIDTKSIKIKEFIQQNVLTDKLVLYNKAKLIFSELETKYKSLANFRQLILSPKLMTIGTYNREYLDQEEDDKLSNKLKSFTTEIISILISNSLNVRDFMMLFIHLISFFNTNFYEKRFLALLSFIIPEGDAKDIVLNSLDLKNEEFQFIEHRITAVKGVKVYFEITEIANQFTKHCIMFKELLYVKNFINAETQSFEGELKKAILNEIDTFLVDLKSELEKIIRTRKLNSNVVFKINSFISNTD